MTQRKLPKYYQFIIDNSVYINIPLFRKINFDEFKSYEKLTKGQWNKAQDYLTRELIPFSGYRYLVKPGYENKIIKVT